MSLFRKGSSYSNRNCILQVKALTYRISKKSLQEKRNTYSPLFCRKTSSFISGLWDLQYREFVSNQSQVYSTFAGAAEAVFPLFETMPNELHLFVSEALEEMHSSLFEDTQMLTLAQELGGMFNSFPNN